MFDIMLYSAAIIGIIACAATVCFMFATVSNRKEGVPLFPRVWLSPFNVLFMPSRLNPRGLRYRRLTLISATFFVGLLMLVFLAGLILGRVRF